MRKGPDAMAFAVASMNAGERDGFYQVGVLLEQMGDVEGAKLAVLRACELGLTFAMSTYGRMCSRSDRRRMYWLVKERKCFFFQVFFVFTFL